jgi:hypothetical protein
VNGNTARISVKAAQVGHARDRLGLGDIAHRTPVGQQVAGGDVDPVEILQRSVFARQDLDGGDLGAILQDVADTDLAHELLPFLCANDLLGVKAELIEEPNGLTDGTVDDRTTRGDTRVHQVDQDGKGTHQAHEHRANADHQVVHLAQRIGELAKDHGDDPQETILDTVNGLSNTLQGVGDLLEHLQEGPKQLINGIHDVARLILEGLHGTAGEVARDVHPHQARKGHVHGVAALLDPVLLELIQTGQDPELHRNEKCDECRHPEDDEIHCHENGLIPAREINRVAKMESMSLLELKQLAKAKRIKQYYIMRRAQLIELLSMEALPQTLVLEKMTVTELRDEAKRRGMRGFWRRSKEELLQLLYPGPQENQQNESYTKKHDEPESHDPQNVGVELPKDALEERLQNVRL